VCSNDNNAERMRRIDWSTKEDMQKRPSTDNQKPSTDYIAGPSEVYCRADEVFGQDTHRNSLAGPDVWARRDVVGSPRASLPGGRRVCALSLDETKVGRRSEGGPAGANDALARLTGRDANSSARVEVRSLIR